MRGLACSIEFMRRFERLAKQAGWRPGQGRRGVKKPIVDALSHHFCIADSQIYRLLKAVEIQRSCAIRVNANNGEAIHPTILVEASAAEDPKAMVERAVDQGWTAYEVRNEVKRQRKAKAPPLPKGLYEVIVADPPWPIDRIERECRFQEEKELDYLTMSLDEIKAMKIPAGPNAHLFLWTVQRLLPDAFEVLNRWGFRYVCWFVWLKNGGFQPFGLPQYDGELILYARTGHPEFRDVKDFKTCFAADRRAHSQKPKLFYEMVARVTGGRRLDMFSREVHPGFDQWGDEPGKFAMLDVIREGEAR